jgi:hypothetical protein
MCSLCDAANAPILYGGIVVPELLLSPMQDCAIRFGDRKYLNEKSGKSGASSALRRRS